MPDERTARDTSSVAAGNEVPVLAKGLSSRSYRDIVIELRDVDTKKNTFVVTVLPSGESESDPVTVPLRLKELNTLLRKVDTKTISFDQLMALGEQLGNRLLPAGVLRSIYEAALQKAGRDGGVRLRLIIRDATLAELPWEFAYVQRIGEEKHRSNFLLLNPQVSLVRHEVMPVPPAPVTPADPKRLRVVVAIADVTRAQLAGIGEVEFDVLDLASERALVEELKVLRVADVTVDMERMLDDATLDEVDQALLKSADIFHFAGHGFFLTKEKEPEAPDETLGGYIMLQSGKSAGDGVAISADRVATMLQRAGVRLAVLGACESGRRDDGSAWSSVTPALVRRGLPAAVSMQYEIVDEQAKEFTRMLYSALASGLSIDEAVSVGRQALLDTDAGKGMEWGVPVLYMRASDGALFPALAAQASPLAAQLRLHIEQVVDTVAKGGSMIGIRAVRLPNGDVSVHQRVNTVYGQLIGLDLEEHNR